MNSERIKEIQEATAYPVSLSVKQGLLQVWNECEQDSTIQWVSVKDALPDEYSRVVIYKLDCVLICLGIAIYSNKKFMFDATMLNENDFERLSDKPIMGVTHYLLLPEMPKV